MTITLRYSDSFINAANWESALALVVIDGQDSSYPAVLPYSGETVFFALRWQDATGAWSPLSNNAFWPHEEVYLPLAMR